MANVNKPSDPLLVAIYTKRGGLYRGVRRSGQIVARRGTSHHIKGHVKAGLTVAQLATIYRDAATKLGDGHYVTVHAPNHQGPIVSEAKQAKRESTKAQHRKAEEERSNALLRIEGGLRTPEDMERYVCECLRQGVQPENPSLRYVYKMARWHGGRVGPWLGHAVVAAQLLHKMPAKDRADLDGMADRCAKLVYGTDMAAAARWAKAGLI